MITLDVSRNPARINRFAVAAYQVGAYKAAPSETVTAAAVQLFSLGCHRRPE